MTHYKDQVRDGVKDIDRSLVGACRQAGFCYYTDQHTTKALKECEDQQRQKNS